MKEYILPVHDLIVHPGLTVPVYVDTPRSIACLEAATKQNQTIVLCPQHSWSYPSTTDDIYTTGTIGDIAQVLHMPDGTIHTIIKTTNVVDLHDLEINNGLFVADTTPIDIIDDSNFEQTLTLRDKIANALQTLSMYKKIKIDKINAIIQNYPLPAFVDSVIQMINVDTDTAVNILKMRTWYEKLVALLEQITVSIEAEKIEANINRRVRSQMENGQKQAILQEKMRAIQKEMGEDVESEINTSNMRKQIEKTAMPGEAKEKALSEFKRMRAMSPDRKSVV